MDGQQITPQPILHSRGLKFPLDKTLLPPKVRKLLRFDGYEQKEAEAALRLIKKHDRVLELGAGIGFMSTLIGTMIGPEEIHCCEANPLLIDYIEQVHKLNGVENAHIHNVLLGAQDGEADFFIRDNILGSSMSPLANDPKDISVVSIRVRNGRDFMQQIKPTVVVCDIEGAEADLFPNLDFTGVRAVLIELHPQWLGRKGIGSVFRTLDQAGLVYYPQFSHGKVAVFRSDW